MKGLIPFGSITVSGPGALTQALSTTFATLGLFSGAGGANGPASTYDDGDPAVTPDKANNRITVSANPGVYKVTAIISGITDAAQDIWLTLAKNGTAITDMQSRARWTDAVKNQLVLTGYVNITAADNPGTIATKPDPSTSGFVGAGGFSKMQVPLTLQIKSGASTPTITLEHAQFMVERVG